MGNCYDCGEDTLFDGVCVDCSHKRFNDYPHLKNRVKELEEKLLEVNLELNVTKERMERNDNWGLFINKELFLSNEKLKKQTNIVELVSSYLFATNLNKERAFDSIMSIMRKVKENEDNGK